MLLISVYVVNLYKVWVFCPALVWQESPFLQNMNLQKLRPVVILSEFAYELFLY